LGLQIKVAQRLNLFHPPILTFKVIRLWLATGKDEVLGFVSKTVVFGVINAVYKQMAVRGEHVAHLIQAAPLAGRFEVVGNPAIGVGSKFYGKVAAISGFEDKGVFFPVKSSHISSGRI
jgi:hypothetical protein